MGLLDPLQIPAEAAEEAETPGTVDLGDRVAQGEIPSRQSPLDPEPAKPVTAAEEAEEVAAGDLGLRFLRRAAAVETAVAAETVLS